MFLLCSLEILFIKTRTIKMIHQLSLLEQSINSQLANLQRITRSSILKQIQRLAKVCWSSSKTSSSKPTTSRNRKWQKVVHMCPFLPQRQFRHQSRKKQLKWAHKKHWSNQRHPCRKCQKLLTMEQEKNLKALKTETSSLMSFVLMLKLEHSLSSHSQFRRKIRL